MIDEQSGSILLKHEKRIATVTAEMTRLFFFWQRQNATYAGFWSTWCKIHGKELGIHILWHMKIVNHLRVIGNVFLLRNTNTTLPAFTSKEVLRLLGGIVFLFS
jgi:hypothetical protein